MAWQAGQSGNPNGSHGHTRASKGERLSDLANNYTISALNVVVSILEDPEAKHADRLLAARMLFDRAVGTPVQAVTVQNNLTISLVELLAGLPGPKAAVIEHEAPPPPLVSGISLQEASEAAAELEGQAAAAGDARQVEQEEADVELVLMPANDDGTPTQPGGE